MITTQKRAPRAPRLDLNVTPDIIERALPADSGHCIYADAIKQAVPNATHISVDLQTCRFTDPGRGLRYVYLTPRLAQIDLVNFDQGVKPSPKVVRLRGAHVLRSAKKGTKGPAALRGGARVASDQSGLGAPGNVPRRIGGNEPPIGAYAHVGGKRRAFGLRGLGQA